MRYVLTFSLALAFAGCITEDDPAADDGDGGGQTDGDGSTVGGNNDGGGTNPDGGDVSNRDAQVPDGPRADRGVEPDPFDQGPPRPDEGPPPDDHDALVAALCERVASCFEQDCPPLAGSSTVDNVCESLDDTPNGILRRLLDSSCQDLLLLIFQEDEDAVDAYCSDEPPTPTCERICDFLPECGVEDTQWCPGFCRQLDEDGQACYVDAEQRGDCQDFFECFEEEPPEPEEVCEPLCEKQWRCLANECAPGTIELGWFTECEEACFDNPPEREEAEAVIQGWCAEILPGLFAADAELEARCEAQPDEACVQLCNGRLGACDIDECEARCADWNEVNFLCINYVGECDQYEACLQDGVERDRCEAICDRYSSCLEEACPPRIIRPTLHEECAAGCLFDVPEAEEAEFYLELECREVREFVYEDNRELAPLCEGDREFRPSPDECVAFCESTLAECIGVGGRQFCLGACATLERDQYQCALEAQGDCVAIDRCLE